jgi:hypothetical protein
MGEAEENIMTNQANLVEQSENKMNCEEMVENGLSLGLVELTNARML